MISISEIYNSIQGEGKFSGELSTFIRFMGCCLNCSFCDTKWTWKDGEPQPSTPSIFNKSEELTNFLDNFYDSCEIYPQNVVITGGEPLLIDNINMMNFLIRHLIDRYCDKITFETTTLTNVEDIISSSIRKNLIYFNSEFTVKYQNGLNYLSFDNIHYSISPKLQLFCYPHKTDITLDEIIKYYSFDDDEYETLMDKDIKFYYKFVYNKKYENEILQLIDTLPYSFINKIYIMPLTPNVWDKDKYTISCQESADFCLKYGLNYSPRLHVDIWGLKTGV